MSVNTYTYWWELALKISTWSSLYGKIRNMEQSDCLSCFLTKTEVLMDWKRWSKKFYNTGTVRTMRGRPLPNTSNIEQRYLCCQFFYQCCQSTKTPVFVHISHFLERFDQVLIFSANSHHWNWRHNYVISSKEYVTNRWLFLKIYNRYSFSYKCWHFFANWLICLEVIKENRRRFLSEHSVDHSRDVLPSKFLGIILKKLNSTQ